MTYREVMTRATKLRPCALMTDEERADTIHRLDCKIAIQLGVEKPRNPWPEDGPLLIPHPWDDIYVYDLCCEVDYINQEFDLHNNDNAVLEAHMREWNAHVAQTKHYNCSGWNTM